MKLSVDESSTPTHIIINAEYDCTDAGIDAVSIFFNAPTDIIDDIAVVSSLNMSATCNYDREAQRFCYVAFSTRGTESNIDKQIAVFTITLKEPLKDRLVLKLLEGTDIYSPEFANGLKVSDGTLEAASVNIDPIVWEKTELPAHSTETPDSSSDEPEHMNEYPYEIDYINISGKTVTLNVNGDQNDQGVLIIASYNDRDELISIFTDDDFPKNELTEYEINTEDPEYISVFVWDSIDTMRALSYKVNSTVLS